MKCEDNIRPVRPERIRCDPRDCRFIVQPIRSNAAKILRAFAEPHWVMRLLLRKLSRSSERFRHARSAQQEHAAPALQAVKQLLHVYIRKPSLPGFLECPRSIGRPSPARSRLRKSLLVEIRRKELKTQTYSFGAAVA